MPSASSNPASLKVIFGSEIRRFNIAENSYGCLVHTVCTIFQQSANAINLCYVDEEGDQVSITSDDELQFALKHFRNQLKMVLTSKPAQPISAINPPHQRVAQRERYQHKGHHSTSTSKYDASKVVNEFFVVDGKITNQEQKKPALLPGSKFSKVFVVQNESTVPWPADTRVTFLKGDQEAMQVPNNIFLPRSILPNEEFNVVICGTAPKEARKFFAVFRLATASGELFGRRLRFAFQVVDDNKPRRDEDMEDVLNQLKMMGFNNEPLNKRLFHQKKGDFDKILDMLAVIEGNKERKNANKN